ncbi:MAG: hypothetical protein AAF648_16755 [Pseudomonadota bacterium]
MRPSNYYKPLLPQGPRRALATTEAEYLNLWRQIGTSANQDLLVRSLYSGMAADRLAWVFIAGYQSACRHAFPTALTGLDAETVLAFAVSEDRSDPPQYPGLVQSAGTAPALTGTKTWVAAAHSVEQLIVRAGGRGQRRYWRVPRTLAGLTIDTGGPASFLSDLSQGRAHFSNVAIADLHELPREGAANFGTLEALYLYTAFCGHVLGADPEEDLRLCAYDCLDAVAPALASVGSGVLDVANLQKADARAQDLLVRLSGNRLRAAGDWDADQRLIAMYSKPIRRLA